MSWHTKAAKSAAVLTVLMLVVLSFLTNRLSVSHTIAARYHTMLRKNLSSSIYLDIIGKRKAPITDHDGEDATRNSSYKSIVWLNSPKWLNGMTSRSTFSSCHFRKCTISYKRSDLTSADAVLVHGVELPDTPSPPHRRRNQVYVFVNFEPPVYTNISQTWRNVFNMTLTYRNDSDIQKPYGKLQRNGTNENANYYTNILKRKTKAVAWFVSRCQSQSKRESYVKELQKYVQIDIFGRCGPNKCGHNCSSILEKYRFYLAFENAICHDYVTEKFFKTFKYDLIPVVRGGANYSRMFGDEFLINTADFTSIRAVGVYLNFLMTHDAEYIKLLVNKHKYFVVYPMPWCRLCEKLHTTGTGEKTYDINTWFNPRTCSSPRDI